MSENQTPEAVADDGLEHLLLQAQNIDAGNRPNDAPATVDALPTNTAAELESALTMARLMVAPMFNWWPEFSATWSDSTVKAISESGGAIMDKHGWSVGAVLGQWGPYIALIAAVGPPAFVTFQAIKAREKEAPRVSAEQTKD